MITTEMIERHRLWLVEDDGGVRLEFHASLRRANLQDANLRRANLQGADLQYADLQDADLRDADLQYADLQYANLRGAEGILNPPINDPRGYRCIAVWHSDGWRIAAGCRWHTVAEAREHWGADYDGDRSIGDTYLAAVEWVAKQSREGEL